MALPATIPLSAEVRRRVHGTFADADEAARRLVHRCGGSIPLMGTSEDAERRWVERIRLAVIEISQGDLRRLDEAIDLAHRDGRDVLMWAMHLEGPDSPSALG